MADELLFVIPVEVVTSAMDPKPVYVVLEKSGGNYEIEAETVAHDRGVLIFKNYGDLEEPHAFVCTDSIYAVIRKDHVEKIAQARK